MNEMNSQKNPVGLNVIVGMSVVGVVFSILGLITGQDPSIISMIIGIAINTFFAVGLFKRFNPARLIMMAFCILSLVLLPITLIQFYRAHPNFSLMLLVGPLALSVPLVLLLYLKSKRVKAFFVSQ